MGQMATSGRPDGGGRPEFKKDLDLSLILDLFPDSRGEDKVVGNLFTAYKLKINLESGSY